MKRTDLNFGISSWTYPWSVGVAEGPQPASKMTATGLLDKAHELDVKLLQIADNLPLEKLSMAELTELRSYAVELGISLEVGTKGFSTDHLLNFLDIAGFLNSPILRTLPGSFKEKVDLAEVEVCIREILPAFEKAGVVLTLENTEAFTAQAYLELMEKINHPNLRMCIDLANALGKMEGPNYFLQKLAPWCGNYHFKDVKIIRSPSLMGFSVVGKPSGQGDIPINWVMPHLKSYDLFPSIIIEFWPPFTETIEETMKLEHEWAKQSVEFMRTLSW